MSKPCKWCESTQHTSFYCFRKPRGQINKVSRRRLENPVALKPRKAINKRGPRAIKWEQASKEWKVHNPPDSNGFWYCRVGGSALTDKRDVNALRLNLCHDLSRARRPDLAFTLSNIYPGCQLHNKEQGSKSYEEYINSSHSPFCADF